MQRRIALELGGRGEVEIERSLPTPGNLRQFAGDGYQVAAIWLRQESGNRT